jgi:hypothetical protein
VAVIIQMRAAQATVQRAAPANMMLQGFNCMGARPTHRNPQT